MKTQFIGSNFLASAALTMVVGAGAVISVAWLPQAGLEEVGGAQPAAEQVLCPQQFSGKRPRSPIS